MSRLGLWAGCRGGSAPGGCGAIQDASGPQMPLVPRLGERADDKGCKRNRPRLAQESSCIDLTTYRYAYCKVVFTLLFTGGVAIAGNFRQLFSDFHLPVRLFLRTCLIARIWDHESCTMRTNGARNDTTPVVLANASPSSIPAAPCFSVVRLTLRPLRVSRHCPSIG